MERGTAPTKQPPPSILTNQLPTKSSENFQEIILVCKETTTGEAKDPKDTEEGPR